MVSDWSNLAQLKALTQAADVVLLGPGMGLDAFSCQRLHRILDWLRPDQKLVLDGDALTLLARHPHPLPSEVPIVITPHQAEWQRLSDLAIEDQCPQANLAAQKQLLPIDCRHTGYGDRRHGRHSGWDGYCLFGSIPRRL